jgi:hypothetical protein
MSIVSTVGIDLAKNVLSVHGVDAASSADRMAEVGPGGACSRQSRPEGLVSTLT